MIRTALAVAVLAFGATALVAQSDPIAARKALMKANGDQNRVATEMLEGKRPFNLDEAKKVLATFAETGEKAPALFPDDSKTGDSPDFYEAMTTLAYLPDSCGRSASALPAWWCRAGIRYSPRSKSHPLMFFVTAGWTSALASARRRPSSRGNTKFSGSTENSEGKSPMIISGQ